MDPLESRNFQVRLAETPDEVEAAQALRYRVFYEEMEATPSPEMRARRLDFDAYDAFCDHLLVFDLDAGPARGKVVATYRLLRRSVAERHGGFYTEQEYDLSALLSQPGEILELGRSCVDPDYRARGVMQHLWKGLYDYVVRYDIDLMFGCASFRGTEPKAVGAALAYLHHYHLAPQGLRPRALDQRYVHMGLLPRTGIDVQAVLNDLPPLIKGYLRAGGYVGDGAVVDRQFNTTDVCVIVKTDFTKKYFRHYQRSASDQAAA